MSIKVMTWVWDGFPFAGSDLLAMLALADWCDDTGGRLHPSIRTVAEKIRTSESQARRILRRFEKDGYLAVTGNHSGGAPGSARQYRLNVDLLKQLAAEKERERELANLARAAGRQGGGGSDSGSPFSPPGDSTGGTGARGGMDARGGVDARDGLHGCARGVAPVRETPGTHASQTIKEPLENHHLTKSIAGDPADVPSGEAAGDPPSPAPANPKPEKFNPVTVLIGMDVAPQVAADWLTVRKLKKAAVTQTAIDGVVREAAKVGLSLNEALSICCENSWAGFKASWLENQQAQLGAGQGAAADLGFDVNNESTWGLDSRGVFDGALYIEHKRLAFLARNGAVNGGMRDMGAAEVVR